MFSKKPISSSVGNAGNSTTLIANGTRVTGDVSFAGHLEIEGEVVGNVVANGDDKAMVRVLQHGCIKGEITSPRVVINGRVEGNVYCSKHLELAANAEVEGDVHYDTMEMASGAHVNGALVYESSSDRSVKLIGSSNVVE